MRRLLGIHNVGGFGKYLGLPEQIGRNKSTVFNYITDAVKNKTQGWNNKFLSHGGKEILLKAVATAMPVYAMNIFKLTNQICDDINSVLAKFWWNKGEDKQGMHWVNWERLSIPKKEGGLGFKDLKKFNVALLAKQVWRIMQRPTSMVATVLKARYFQHNDILNASKGVKPSYAWKSLLEGRDLLIQGMRFIVGNGESINVFLDPWIVDHPPRPPKPRLTSQQNITVAELIDKETRRWNEDKVRELISDEDIETILEIKLCDHDAVDILGWSYNADGLYTVKSGYWLATHLPNQQPVLPPPGDTFLKKKLWKINSSPKIKHFVWKLLSDMLPIGENLKRRHISADSVCKRCFKEEEDLNHCFFTCDYAKALWRGSNVANQTLLDANAPVNVKMGIILDCNLIPALRHFGQLPLWILWRIWKSQNMLIFQKQSTSWEKSLSLAKMNGEEWNSVQIYHSHTVGSTKHSTSNRLHGQVWKRPRQGTVKCNYDASFLSNATSANVGWVIRDENGVFLGAAQAHGGKVKSPLEAELHALLIAMQFCWAKGYKNIVFEGDNRKVVSLLTREQIHLDSYNWIRTINRWKDKFEQVEWAWIRRSSNIPADLLAKSATTNSQPFIFHFYVPRHITSAIHADYVRSSN